MTGLRFSRLSIQKQVVDDYTPVFCSLGSLDKQIKRFPGTLVFSVDVVVKNPLFKLPAKFVFKMLFGSNAII